MSEQRQIDAALAERLATLALTGVAREYPNKIAHVLHSDADVKAPRALTPVFYGCFDWHSAVHGHWTLARLAKMFPRAAFATRCVDWLSGHLTAARIEGERAYLEPRPGFERPYGLAWLPMLAVELRRGGPALAAPSRALEPLETLASQRLLAWVSRLPFPIRSGEHAQSAFAMTLALDHATATGDVTTAQTLRERANYFYGRDRDGPLRFEPSGHDFLSPCLTEAELMRRTLSREKFIPWFDAFLPNFDADQLRPARSPDPSDGKLAHLDGLNLSRAAMLWGIARALPEERAARCRDAAQRHFDAGAAAVHGDHYAGTHWLGTFALYAAAAAH